MATPRHNTCCTKKILLLLVWQMMIEFSWSTIAVYLTIAVSANLTMISSILASLLAPVIGWLADVKFGRYETIKFGSLISFIVSIFIYSAVFIAEMKSIFLSASIVIVRLGTSCYSAAMLPFLTDQLIGATSDELSAVVQWYVWTNVFGKSLSVEITNVLSNQIILTEVAIIFAIPFAVIIISDCLCQQWLDRTHKVTNPIKLIIQVLNYTRKHRYPERRSAFTYIDEEQPTRMDFGKEKFGGPFTEEEVEDVKTVLRLIPLVICLSFFSVTKIPPANFLIDNTIINEFINNEIASCLFPLLLIPVYRLLLHRFIHRYTPSMLNSIAIGMALCLVGYIALEALVIKGVVDSDDVQSYLSCTKNTTLPYSSEYYVEWYWKLGPYLLYGAGRTITTVLLFELIIAQSPDKMKGFVLGVMLASQGINLLIGAEILFQINNTLCSHLSLTTLTVAVFVVFLVLSKCYTLRERNREINIQAIVEEHYERYMDQEEEYMREQHYFRDKFFVDTIDT